MCPGLLQLAEEKQQVCQIYPAGGVVRMMSDSFAEQRARGFLVSGVENQGPEIIERAKIGRRPPKQLEIVALGFFEQALFAEKTGAFEAGL